MIYLHFTYNLLLIYFWFTQIVLMIYLCSHVLLILYFWYTYALLLIYLCFTSVFLMIYLWSRLLLIIYSFTVRMIALSPFFLSLTVSSDGQAAVSESRAYLPVLSLYAGAVLRVGVPGCWCPIHECWHPYPSASVFCGVHCYHKNRSACSAPVRLSLQSSAPCASYGIFAWPGFQVRALEQPGYVTGELESVW